MSRSLRIVVVTAILLVSCSGSSDSADDTPTTTGADTTTTAVPITTVPETTSPITTASPPVKPATWFDGALDGTCFNDVFTDEGDFDFSVPPQSVDCNGPHDNEVVSTVGFADGEFPSDETLIAQAESLCGEDMVSFLGRSPEGSGLITPWLVVPDEDDWSAGVRHGVCAVFGSEPLVGTAASGNLTAPGEVLAVVSQTDRFTEVWLVNTDTGALDRNLSDGSLFAQASPPSIRSGGRIVAYAAGPDDIDRDIFLVDLDGDIVRIVDGVPAAGSPRFSPEGESLAYIAAPDDEFDIYILDLEDGNTRKLTDNPDRDTSPSWSPDGSRIAFRSRIDGNSDVYVVGADGSNLTRLTDDPGFDGDPTWSPDGAQILFTSDRAGNFDIWIMSSDGTSQRQLTTHPADDEFPSWSSDGSLIAFQSSRHSGVTVWLMRADGSEQSDLTWVGPTGYPSFAPAS